MASKCVLGFLVIVCVQQICSYRWTGITVDSNAWYQLINIDYTIIGETSMIFAIIGCKGADIILYENVDSGGYVYMRFGDSDNQYSLIFASTHCDSNGCSPGSYKVGSHLDCSSYKVFWARWDNIGGFQVGHSNVLGEEIFMSMQYDLNNDGKFTLRHAKATANVAGTYITFQFFIDHAPEIQDPDGAGRGVFTISEDSPIGTSVAKFGATDLENDTLVWGLMSGDPEAFKVNYGTGTLDTNETYDYETQNYYSIVLGTSDGFNTVNTTFNLEITDIDDNDPVLTINSTVTLLEELPDEHRLGGYYTLTDPDTSQDFTYTLTGTDVTYFKVDTDGAIKINSRVNREALTGSTLTFTLTVTDSAGHTATDDITVTVMDVNDHVPSCTDTIHFVTLTEAGTVANDKIVDLTCTDNDEGVNAQMSTAVANGDTNSAFSTTGTEVFVDTTKLDFEAMISSKYRYYLTVSVYDTPAEGPVHNAHVSVIAEITGINEHAPEWSSPAPDGNNLFPNLSLDENAVPGTLIVTYTTTDADAGTDGVITYEIVSVTADTTVSAPEKFHIDPENGELRLAEMVDADSGVTYYEVVVKAVDKGTTPQSAEATQRVTINNVNDNRPVFNSPVYETTVNEDVAVGFTVTNVDVSDVDGDSITLTLSGNHLTFFEVSGTSIILKQALNYETAIGHSVGITASDGVHQNYYELTVNVNNINDEAPVITINSHNTILEEIPTTTVVYGYYSVSDPDGSDSFTHELTEAGSSYFTIDGNGNLKVAARMDREAMASKSIQLTLTVKDSADHTDTETFTITVVDINDNTPDCGQSLYILQVEEMGPESDKKFADSLTCTDADEGNNAAITLTIISGDTAIFRYDGFELWGAPNKIDYEGLASSDYKIRLVVEAADTPDEGNPNVGPFVVIIEVTGKNEDPPVFTNPVPDGSGNLPDQSVAEDTTPGTAVLTFAATDSDDSVDGKIHFEIVSITSANDTSTPDMFNVGYESGELMVAGSLDFDTVTGGVAYYNIVVKAVDGGTTPKEEQKTMKITLTGVNDNAPVFNNVNYELSVNEDAAVNDVIASLSVTDPDGDTVTLTATAGDTTAFGVSGTDVVVLSALDFETRTCYYLDISASDGTLSSDISVTISVNNVNDLAPVITVAGTVELLEETPIGTVLYGLYIITDPDVGDTLSFSISGTDNAYFTTTSTGDLELAKRVDFDGGVTSLTVDVTATDAAAMATTQAVIITVKDVNDNAPKCDQYVYFHTVMEASGADAKLMDAITCTDADTGDNSNFALAVVDGDSGGIFRYVGQELWGAADSIDYEALASSDYKYYLTVSVTDQPSEGPQNTGYILVVIKVTGSNEFAPVWTVTPDGSGYFPAVYTSEDSPVGTSLTSFSATDGDDSTDGEVLYELVSVTEDSGTTVTDKVWLHPETGVLYVATLLDADAGPSYYDVAVKATDGTNEVTGMMKLTIDTVNDNAPEFTDTTFIATVAEDVSVGHTVLTLGVNDIDGDTITLSVEGTWAGTFSGDGLDILTKASLDYEAERCYSVLVRASDGTHTTDRLITVEVTDVDDMPPEITIFTGVSVPEELPNGVIIGDVFSVADPDTTNSFTYTLSGSQSEYFDIKSTTGHLSILKNMDRDGSEGVTYLDGLAVTVTDPAGLFDTANFQIDVADINDMAPAFSDAVYTASVKENSATAQISRLTCTDKDSGPNGDVTISIPTAENPSGIFSITGDKLFADGSLIDFETTKSFSITVICVDSPTSGTAKTGATLVQIKVTGENEFDPAWDTLVPDGSGSFTGKTMSESDPPGTLIETFKAIDSDTGVDGEIRFEILSITTAEANSVSGTFFMDPDAGTLHSAVYIDADVETGGSAHYDIVVSAKDGGSSVRSVTGTIRVSVTDEDDNGPKFTNQLFEGTVACTNKINDVVASVTTTDADSSTGTFVYSLPVSSTVFSIDLSSGDLNLLINPASIEHSERRQFVVVKAEDSSDTTRTDTTTVFVMFDYCGAATTAATTTTIIDTTTTTAATTTTEVPRCAPQVNTEVIILAVLSGIMAVGIGMLIACNIKSFMKPPTTPSRPSKYPMKNDAFERPLENPTPNLSDDLTLDDPANQFVFGSLPPYTTVGGNFEQLP